MAKTRKARSKKTKNRLRKTKTHLTSTQKLIVKFGKCSKKCLRFGYGTKSYKKCLNKNCRKTLTKLLKKVKKNKKIRGGYGPGGCPVGAPWNADGKLPVGNHYALSKLGGAAGGLSPYSGMNSPSPQRGGTFAMRGDPLGGGFIQQFATNPGRAVMGGLENLHNKYAGKALTASPWPTEQHYSNVSGTKNTTYDIPK